MSGWHRARFRRPVAFGALAIACIAELHAAGVYRHVDANGRVTYSDRPPDHAGTTHEVRVRAKGEAINVVVDRGYAYCGDLQLGAVDQPHRLAPQLEYKRNEYERRVQELSAEYRRTLQQSLHAAPDAAAVMVRNVRRQLEQYQCAERWVHRMASPRGGVDDAIRASIRTLGNEIAALEQRRDEDCGAEPYRDRTGILYAQQSFVWGEWERCARRYELDLRALERDRDDHRRAQGRERAPAYLDD